MIAIFHFSQENYLIYSIFLFIKFIMLRRIKSKNFYYIQNNLFFIIFTIMLKI